jgi:hypothetical protein
MGTVEIISQRRKKSLVDWAILNEFCALGVLAQHRVGRGAGNAGVLITDGIAVRRSVCKMLLNNSLDIGIGHRSNRAGGRLQMRIPCGQPPAIRVEKCA